MYEKLFILIITTTKYICVYETITFIATQVHNEIVTFKHVIILEYYKENGTSESGLFNKLQCPSVSTLGM